MITVEAALGLTALITVAALLFFGLAAVNAKGQVCQQVRDAARHFSMTATLPQVPETVLDVTGQGGRFTVTGTRRLSSLPLLHSLSVQCQVSSTREHSIVWGEYGG